MTNCECCPRLCSTDRETNTGFCKQTKDFKIAYVGLHRWEEPIISGTSGSGAIFFSGCNLRCIYCQNHYISSENHGVIYDEQQLIDAMLFLQSEGAHNINLVTATQYSIWLINVIDKAKKNGLKIPIVYNCGGYESKEIIKKLEDTVDIYLPDFKYMDNKLSKVLSCAENYPNIAIEAINEMLKQKKETILEDGIMKQGVIIRHLVLPGCLNNSRKVLSTIKEEFGNDVYVSLMSQYFPIKKFEGNLSFLNRRLTKLEYDRITDYFFSLEFENGYVQDRKSADKGYVPVWQINNIE